MNKMEPVSKFLTCLLVNHHNHRHIVSKEQPKPTLDQEQFPKPVKLEANVDAHA